jgi:hypothetical protein
VEVPRVDPSLLLIVKSALGAVRVELALTTIDPLTSNVAADGEVLIPTLPVVFKVLSVVLPVTRSVPPRVELDVTLNVPLISRLEAGFVLPIPIL